MSPVADLSDAAVAGRRAGESYRQRLKDPMASSAAMPLFMERLFAHVGTGGAFDYQRQGHQILGHITGFTQLRQFRPVSNVNVGLFCQQAGLTLEETLTISGKYAGAFSGNSDPNRPYGLDEKTEYFIMEGYKIGQSGMFEPRGRP